MFNTQIVETAPLTNWLSGGISHVFSRYSAQVLTISILMLAGCATTGRPDTQADSSTSTVISDVQRGETTPKATEESGTSTGACAVVGAIIGGAVGVVVFGPICANEFTVGACPTAILAIGLTAVAGGAIGVRVCNKQ